MSFDEVDPLRLYHRFQLCHRFRGYAALKKLLFDAFFSYFVELVNSHGDVGYSLLFSRDFCYACKYLAVIDPDCHLYFQLGENAVNYL